jgi:CBS domain-containing protein
MSDRPVTDPLVRPSPVLRADDTIETAVRRLAASELPALPVIEPDGRFLGVFGEREFLAALFPGYLGQLGNAGFVMRSLEAALEKRATCGQESVGAHCSRDHVEVPSDFSDIQVAETFLHHDALVLPVIDAGRVAGVIVRGDFFRALADRVLD